MNRLTYAKQVMFLKSFRWTLFFCLTFHFQSDAAPNASDFADYVESPSLIIEDEPPFDCPDCRDLEDLAQSFVLETKRIVIPGYPDAFNPSIIRWRGKLLMCFRTYHPTTRSTNEIALVYLNDDCEPISEPQFLKFTEADPNCLTKRQDPRLVEIDGCLHVIYNNSIGGEVRRMLVGKIEFVGSSLIVHSVQCLRQFEGEREGRAEKNWVPFDFQGQLHLAYSIVPHKIFHPVPGTDRCQTVASTLSSFKWDWGVLRGGTPALLEGDEYLAFFHCSKSMATVHSQGKSIPHYFMGAYTFAAHPPFTLKRMSPIPIVGKNFYKGKAYKTWKPCRVVFPGGYVMDERFVWVFYGRQDHEIWVAKMDKKGLLDSLMTVPSPCNN